MFQKIGSYKLTIEHNPVNDDENNATLDCWEWDVVEYDEAMLADDVASGVSWNSEEEAKLCALAVIQVLMMKKA